MIFFKTKCVQNVMVCAGLFQIRHVRSRTKRREVGVGCFSTSIDKFSFLHLDALASSLKPKTRLSINGSFNQQRLQKGTGEGCCTCIALTRFWCVLLYRHFSQGAIFFVRVDLGRSGFLLACLSSVVITQTQAQLT
jgi:hypothetical protein